MKKRVCLVLLFILVFMTAVSAYVIRPPTYKTKWGSEGSAEGQFKLPAGVALNEYGHVYVVDQKNNRIQKFHKNGSLLYSWGKAGKAAGEFDTPWGIALDAEGNIYVADMNNHRIQKFDRNHQFIKAWGSGGGEPGKFNQPIGIAIDAVGSVYVTEWSNHRIQKFTRDGTYITHWGSHGSGNGQFNLPWGIALDASGNVYVADFRNNRIQKFDPNGQFLGIFAGPGTTDGTLKDPIGITIDGARQVYVTDNCRTQIFDETGKFMWKFCTFGTADGYCLSPQGIAVNKDGYIHVADGVNNRIQVFTPAHITPTTIMLGPLFDLCKLMPDVCGPPEIGYATDWTMPGLYVTITGKRFGDTPGLVRMSGPKIPVVTLINDRWENDRISVRVPPDLSGVFDDPDAYIVVQRSDREYSQRKPIRFQATKQLRLLTPQAVTVAGCPTSTSWWGDFCDDYCTSAVTDPWTFRGWHKTTCCFEGDSGTDVFKIGPLKNGWKFSRIDIVNESAEFASQSMEPIVNLPAKDKIEVRVNWKTFYGAQVYHGTPSDGSVNYYGQVYVWGPKGTNP
jgi:DNA-binding beta-propeller fold protein YncE